MGYSCAAAADDTLRKLGEILSPRDGGAPSNEYTGTDGRRYFFEVGRENADGAVTGQVVRMIGDGHAQRAGSFRIEPNGKVTRFPFVARQTMEHAEAFA